MRSYIYNETPYILITHNSLAGTLKAKGYYIQTAYTKDDVLSSLTNQLPDLIILDSLNTGIDSFELCKQIRLVEDYNTIPIIFISEKNSIIKALDLGAQDFILRPYKTDELIARINSHYKVKLYAEKKFEESSLQLTQLNETLIESKESYRVLVENSNDMIFCLDTSGRFTTVNKAFNDVLCNNELIIGKDFSHIPNIDHQLWINNFNTVIKNRIAISFNSEHLNNADERIVLYVTLIPIFNKRDEIAAITGTGHDISSLIEKEEMIKQLAYYDVLTGLPNRILFSDRVSSAINLAKRYDKQMAVMFLDLDNFKNVNDSMGHHIGDLLLQEIAIRLKSAVRESDTISRMGGDEFTILLQNLNHKKDVFNCAIRIMKSIAPPCLVSGYMLDVTVSIGIAFYPEDGSTYEELLKNADTAMYKAKESGRNNYHLYNTAMKDELCERLDFEKQLKNALQNDELRIHYQPQVCVKTGHVRGVEALMRWHCPHYGWVEPAKFIPILEQTGLIIPFGEWILYNACLKNMQWHQKGFKDMIVSVNIALAQLKQYDFSDKLRAILLKTGLEPQYLELEITESILIDRFDEMYKKITELKEIGVKISLDDFGTGFSSINYLRRMPIDTLKLDKLFMNDINDDKNQNDIIGTLIALAHRMNMLVIVEGVETKQQMDYLVENQADYLQGYYLCKPGDESKISKMFF